MAKVNLPSVVSGYNLQKINDNDQAIATELNENVLYRRSPEGEPNEMHNDLDMNGNRIYNLPEPVLDHEAARYKDVRDAKDWAEKSQDAYEKTLEALAAGSVYIGNYGPGLVIEEYTSFFGKDGQWWRPSPDLVLPYTTTGDWGDEEGLFVSIVPDLEDLEDRVEAVENEVDVLEGTVQDLENDVNSLYGPSGSSLVGFNVPGESTERTVYDKLSDVLHARDFGVVADGVTNDTAAMQRAITAMETTGKNLKLPAGVILVTPGALTLGNGTGSSYSTRNCQTIIGEGSNPYLTPSSGVVSGTCIRAASAGGSMLTVVGGAGGLELSSFTIDCAGLASVGMILEGVSHSSFTKIGINQFIVNGLVLRGKATSSPDSPTWCANNVFNNLSLTSTVNTSFSAGLYLTGDLTTNRDPHRNTFINVVIQINKNPTDNVYACQLDFADSNTFIECDFGVVGSGLGHPLLLSNLVTPGHPFPQNNFFYGCSLAGADIFVAGDIGENTFIAHTTRDLEPIPTHPMLKGFTDRGEWFSDLVVRRESGSVILKSQSANVQYRIYLNATSLSDQGIHIEQFTGGVWQPLMRLKYGEDPQLHFPGFGGLKTVSWGDSNSGGSGFRYLRIPN